MLQFIWFLKKWEYSDREGIEMCTTKLQFAFRQKYNILQIIYINIFWFEHISPDKHSEEGYHLKLDYLLEIETQTGFGLHGLHAACSGAHHNHH